MDTVLAQSEHAARTRTWWLPEGGSKDGTCIVDNGMDIGERIPIRATVGVKLDRMTVELPGVCEQARGFWSAAAGFGAAQVAP